VTKISGSLNLMLMMMNMNVLSVLLLFVGNVCVVHSIDFDWPSGIYPGKLSFKTF
jgi:hypothetical protein